MLTPTPAPPRAASLTNECTQTSFTPRPPEEEKVFALHPGGRGGEDSHRWLPRGTSHARPCPAPGGHASLAHLEPSHDRPAGKLCLTPHSGHRPVQGGLGLNSILSPPAPGQALGWALFLSFIFSCSNSQAPCPVGPRGVRAESRIPSRSTRPISWSPRPQAFLCPPGLLITAITSTSMQDFTLVRIIASNSAR